MIKLNLDPEAKSSSSEIMNPTPFTISYQDGNTRSPYLPSEKSVCRSRSNRHGIRDWLKIGKGVHQGSILSPCLFNLHAEYITQNAGLDEAQSESEVAQSCPSL